MAKNKVLNKINIGGIIWEHLLTLKNDNTGKASKDDYLTFLFIPIFSTSLLLAFGVTLSENATNIIITTLSILVGLMFNVIVIIFDIIKRDNKQAVKNRLLKETLTNISYSIVLSIIIIAIILLSYIPNEFLKYWATALSYFLIANYFLTVLMIIKRMYSLFTNELKELEDTNAG